jgi:hypothetical protein
MIARWKFQANYFPNDHGDHLENNVLYPVPHRQYVFGL